MSMRDSAKRYIVDRIEDEGWVVLERPDGRTFDMPRELLPLNVQAGDVLSIDTIHGDRTTVLILGSGQHAKEARLEQARARLSRLKRRDPGGDIDL
jgi:hypothetical protein